MQERIVEYTVQILQQETETKNIREGITQLRLEAKTSIGKTSIRKTVKESSTESLGTQTEKAISVSNMSAQAEVMTCDKQVEICSETTFLLINVLLYITQSVCEQCEVVKLVKENNISKKCCVSDRKDLENFDKSSEKIYSVLKLKDITYVCFDIEATTENKGKTIGDESIKQKDGEKNSKKKKPPSLDNKNFGDTSKRCPEDLVLDFDGECIDPF
ncbi:hypothetical protein HHI36_016322 [Cryptolaemus montrouzieri]|uniref:Uncharacterized protein n=1 Tax=Cryptolaemus montrouzieri TaxID=559131 RepID=A0ABD2NJM2_9CUCU